MIRSRKTRISPGASARPHRPPLEPERLEDRTLLAAVTLVNNGPSSNRADIVVLGDGYTAADLAAGTYRSHVEAMVRHLFSENQDPYPRYRNFFNVQMVEVLSPESGIDNPSQQIWRNTALDGTYNCGNVQRAICVNPSKADQAALSAGVIPEIRLVSTNSSEYGGAGGPWAVYAGGAYGSTEVALHELGHSFNGLGDEYASGCTTYTGSEPPQANLTVSPTGQKWSQWLGYNQPGIGIIGAYEGGNLCRTGIYHPSLSSKMRTLGMPFDAVAREKIILDIYNLVDPMDGWLDNRSAHSPTDTLWVRVVDPSVLTVEWYVDGNRVTRAAGQSFRPSDFGVGGGTHTVTARAVDLTDWVRRDRQNLAQSVTWTVNGAANQTPTALPVGPTIADARLVTSTNHGITGVVLTFRGRPGLSKTEMENVSHYQLAAPGRDRRFGTRDDKPLAILSAVYDPVLATLTLTPTRPLAANQLFRVTTGFTGSTTVQAAIPVAATADANSALVFGRGARIAYVDADGDVAFLSLARGGLIELTMGPGDQGPRLRLLNTVPNRSVLSGRINRGRPNGDGTIHLQSISGMAGVVNNLTTPFTVGTISAAIDAVMESRTLGNTLLTL